MWIVEGLGKCSLLWFALFKVASHSHRPGFGKARSCLQIKPLLLGLFPVCYPSEIGAWLRSHCRVLAVRTQPYWPVHTRLGSLPTWTVLGFLVWCGIPVLF